MNALTLFDMDEVLPRRKEVKPIFQIAEVELTYKSSIKSCDRPRLERSRDAFDLLTPIFRDFIDHHEQFWILLMNRANKVIGAYCVSKGGVAGTVADPKIIFQAAIKANASGLILAHNHPSGSLLASQADLDLTKKLKEAGKVLEIQVLDHVILAGDSYFSFADDGLM